MDQDGEILYSYNTLSHWNDVELSPILSLVHQNVKKTFKTKLC